MDAQRIISTHISLSLAAASSSSAPAPLPTLATEPPPEELVDGIRQGSIGLLDVVKGLGEYLTSTEDPVRIRGESSTRKRSMFPKAHFRAHLLFPRPGVNLLAGVLMRIPSEKITRQGSKCF